MNRSVSKLCKATSSSGEPVIALEMDKCNITFRSGGVDYNYLKEIHVAVDNELTTIRHIVCCVSPSLDSDNEDSIWISGFLNNTELGEEIAAFVTDYVNVNRESILELISKEV